MVDCWSQNSSDAWDLGGLLQQWSKRQETKHHKNTASFEKMFQQDSEPLKKEFSRVGNPFEYDSEQMHITVSRNIMDKSPSQSVYSAKCLSQEQCHWYTTDVLVLGKKSIYDTVKGNKLPLYRSTNKVVVSKIRQRVISLKQDCHLFLSLYVACQSHEGDLHLFFYHKNHAYPPALLVYGELHISDTKSDVLKEFDKYGEPCPQSTAEILYRWCSCSPSCHTTRIRQFWAILPEGLCRLYST